ncbi:transposase [Streptomyces gardneri]|uniref:integrase core domain-containing protein n=1 Tax=Nocardia TaxID=1817 RepID=UPI00135CAA26|nr:MULTISPECIES: integrase core domain-containing protein [Nocardia]MBF6169741.1 transposase [Streptomyces gardneri]MBF6208342.1 transposase [Streptomyces gardneri]
MIVVEPSHPNPGHSDSHKLLRTEPEGSRHHVYATKVELVASVDNWIDRYNHDRRHSALGMLGPICYEQSLTDAAKAA